MSMGMLLGNKAHLVNPGYTQIEEVEFDKTFTPVAYLEEFRLLLGILCLIRFKLYHMDVKSAFLTGIWMKRS